MTISLQSEIFSNEYWKCMISVKFSVIEVLNEQARYFSKCSIQVIDNEGQGLFWNSPWGERGGGGGGAPPGKTLKSDWLDQ
jgi:hypothetical protein